MPNTIIIAFYILTHLILKINLTIKGTVFNPPLTNRVTKWLSNLFQSHSANKCKVRIWSHAASLASPLISTPVYSGSVPGPTSVCGLVRTVRRTLSSRAVLSHARCHALEMDLIWLRSWLLKFNLVSIHLDLNLNSHMWLVYLYFKFSL